MHIFSKSRTRISSLESRSIWWSLDLKGYGFDYMTVKGHLGDGHHIANFAIRSYYGWVNMVTNSWYLATYLLLSEQCVATSGLKNLAILVSSLGRGMFDEVSFRSWSFNQVSVTVSKGTVSTTSLLAISFDIHLYIHFVCCSYFSAKEVWIIYRNRRCLPHKFYEVDLL